MAQRRAGRNGKREGKAKLQTQSREARVGLGFEPKQSGTTVREGYRHNRSDEPCALAGSYRSRPLG